jgi:hypothetical protein
VSTSPFSAALVGDVTGQWLGIFTGIGFPNGGVKTNVTLTISPEFYKWQLSLP